MTQGRVGAIAGAAVMAQIAALLASARDDPADHKEAGRRALDLLRAADMTWRDVLPISAPPGGFRTGISGTLLDYIGRTCERLDLLSPFDCARLAVLAAQPEAGNSCWTTPPVKLPTDADFAEWGEVAQRAGRHLDAERMAWLASRGIVLDPPQSFA